MATVQEIWSGIKTMRHETKERIFYVFLIILVALLAFGLGRLSVFYGGKSDFKVQYPAAPDRGGESALQ